MANLTYDRPVATPVETIETDLAVTWRGSELGAAAAALDGSGAGTGTARAFLDLDADESVGADVQAAYQVDLIPTVNQVTGRMTLTVEVTPVLGDGTNGVKQSQAFHHDETADAWQTAAGRARQDPA